VTSQLAERFLVLYGDEMANLDLDRFQRAHSRVGADVSLCLHPNDHPLDSDLVELDKSGWVSAFHNRPHPAGHYFRNLVNAALYIVETRALGGWKASGEQLDFGKDFFPAMLQAGRRHWGYQTPEYIKDIGTPARYDRVCAEYERGVVERSRLDHPQAAVFLDRDGTLNEELGGVTKVDDLVVIPGVAEAIRELNHAGIRTVVVTNQPVVAKGFCSEEDLRRIHNKMETVLGERHAFLDRILYCPHHPERGFVGERTELKVTCVCRKPGVGLIRQAAEDLNLDLSRCWLVGDSTTDLQTARNAGLRSILVGTGHAGKDGKYPVRADVEFRSLAEAVQFVLERNAGP
jgi:histidinol-phosphate phosphatase family protein